MPRFDDDIIDMQALIRRLADQVANATMDAEADRPCSGGAKSQNGYRKSSLATFVGTLTLHFSKLHTGSFFPQDAIERYQRVDRAPRDRRGREVRHRHQHPHGTEGGRENGRYLTHEGPSERQLRFTYKWSEWSPRIGHSGH